MINKYVSPFFYVSCAVNIVCAIVCAYYGYEGSAAFCVFMAGFNFLLARGYRDTRL